MLSGIRINVTNITNSKKLHRHVHDANNLALLLFKNNKITPMEQWPESADDLKNNAEKNKVKGASKVKLTKGAIFI